MPIVRLPRRNLAIVNARPREKLLSRCVVAASADEAPREAPCVDAERHETARGCERSRTVTASRAGTWEREAASPHSLTTGLQRSSLSADGQDPFVASIYHLLSALERGEGVLAWKYAAEMPRGRINLDHALALVAIASLHDTEPDRYEAAVDRWLQRATLEQPAAPIDRLRHLLDWLPDLPAVTELQAICELEAWPVAQQTLDHLLPTAPR